MTSNINTLYLDDLSHDQELDRLCESVTRDGVFYLAGISQLERLHTRAMDSVMDFFTTNHAEQREKCTNQNHRVRRGFSRLESESTAAITNAGNFTDYSMAFSMGLKDNVFPSAEFENIWNKYFDTFYETSRSLTNRILGSINRVKRTNYHMSDAFDPVLRFRYYPDVPEDRCAENLPLRMASHYDISVITLILQSPCENGFVSLQCEVGGRYIDLPTRKDQAIVLCGAVAALLTDGAVVAPLHRVAAPSRDARIGSARTSSVFFLRPAPDFTFSVSLAKRCGLNVDVDSEGEFATFREWMEGNYLNLQSTHDAQNTVQSEAQ